MLLTLLTVWKNYANKINYCLTASTCIFIAKLLNEVLGFSFLPKMDQNISDSLYFGWELILNLKT